MLKQVLKAILKPIIRAILPKRSFEQLKELRSSYLTLKRSQAPVWDGVYSSFQSASPSENIYLKNDQWLEPKRNYVRTILNDPAQVPHTTVADRTLLSFFTLGLRQYPKIRILDIGGEIGGTFALCKRSLHPDLFRKLDYTVLELKSCVEAGRSFWQERDEREQIHFIEKLPTRSRAEPAPYDVVYFGSALQYFEDYPDVIRNCVELEPTYFLFFNALVGEIKTHASLQVNVSPPLPVWKINLEEFSSLLPGYELLYKGSNNQDYAVSHFEPAYRLKATSNLLFARSS